ncbi:acetyl-CoA carboxylase 1 [Trichonephila clavipes]|nr:acetyl-CoA carboxylase 1 [Trichonephila clavipes]
MHGFISVISGQRAVRNSYGGNKSILQWYHSFNKVGCLCKWKSSSEPSVSEAVERVRQSFVRSPRKSTRFAAYELRMLQKTIWKNKRKKINFQAVLLRRSGFVDFMQNNHKENKQFFKSDVNLLSKIQSFKYRIQQQYSQGKYPKVFTPSTAIKHNHQCLKIHVRKDYSQAQPSQNNPHYSLA